MKKLFGNVKIIITAFVLATSIQEASSDSVTFEPAEMNYSSALIDSCRPKLICAINTGQTVIENPDFKLEKSDAFRIQSKFNDCPESLNPGEICKIYVDFCPSLLIEYNAILTFTSNQIVESVQLRGRGHGGN